MITKVSFLAAAAVAAYLVSLRNSKQHTAVKPAENDELHSQQQQNEGETEDDEEGSEVINGSNKQLNNLSEIDLLHDLVRELQQRKVRLERKLLGLCGLKEEQSYMAHLQRHLEEKSAEVDILNLTIASLQAERKVLQEDVKQCALAKKQLEMAKKMIAEMQKKMESDESSIMKGRLLMMEEKVSSFPKDEISVRDAIVEKKLKAVKGVQLQVLTMKRRNKELELEKRELAVKLVSAQARISALSSMTESETIAKVEEDLSRLRHTNEDLTRQVERLQKIRFDMVQELVYQRWLYACLRFETQIDNSPSRETSKHHDLNMNSSLKSDEKIEPLISSNPTYNYSPSSQYTSSTTLSDETDTTTIDSSSSSSQRSSTSKIRKSGFIHSIKRWGKSKDDSQASPLPDRSNGLSKRGLVGRFSASMVPVKTSVLKNTGESTTTSSPSSKAPSLSRGRRVSFSDSVRSESADQRLFDDKEMSGDQKSECIRSTMKLMNSTPNYKDNELVGDQTHDEAASPEVLSVAASPKIINNDSNNNEIADTVAGLIKSSLPLPCVVHEKENKVDKKVVGFVAALFLLLFILVACLAYYSV